MRWRKKHWTLSFRKGTGEKKTWLIDGLPCSYHFCQDFTVLLTLQQLLTQNEDGKRQNPALELHMSRHSNMFWNSPFEDTGGGRKLLFWFKADFASLPLNCCPSWLCLGQWDKIQSARIYRALYPLSSTSPKSWTELTDCMHAVLRAGW